MGASGWAYFTPYQEDIQKALDELRQHIFDEGRYYLLHPYWQDSPDAESYADEMATAFPKEMYHERYAFYLKDFEMKQQRGNQPSTIQELIEWNVTEGTHSIIDINHIVDNPAQLDIFVAAPLTEETLIELFDTTRPTHDMIETEKNDLRGIRSRWQATCIIVYRDDQPDEIFFTGFSGD